MAYGSHWEWRGFGGVSGRFVQIYSDLRLLNPLQSFKDQYIRVPGLNINCKLRKGPENGLKFKRREKTAGNFEGWTEKEEEFFPFPLSQKAFQSFYEMLQNTELTLPEESPKNLSLEMVRKWLTEAGCEIVEVIKKRESRLWQRGRNAAVQVEWACISAPQSCISIGLENASEDADLTDVQYKKILEFAVQELGLVNEPLQPMNYMDAVSIWAKGDKI